MATSKKSTKSGAATPTAIVKTVSVRPSQIKCRISKTVQASSYQPVSVDFELVYDMREGDDLRSIYKALHTKASTMVEVAMRAELEKWQVLDDEWKRKQERRARRNSERDD
jgi:hypothetical protein